MNNTNKRLLTLMKHHLRGVTDTGIAMGRTLGAHALSL